MIGEIIIGFSIVIAAVFLALFLLALFIYVFYMRRAGRLHKKLDKVDKKFSLETHEQFIIKNPYNNSYKYYKAQLHTHTTKSDGKLQPAELVEAYKNCNYSFLAVTDHDKITQYHDFDDETFITISGEETTCHRPFWPLPLGEHLLRLFVNKHWRAKDVQKTINNTLKEGGLAVVNHPSSISGLGTQCWDIEELVTINNIFLIEIANHFSEEEKNIKYWHSLLKKYGPDSPIWGIASDDAHTYEDIDKEWIMVKAEKIDESSLYNALKMGAFYSTQGPLINFHINDDDKKIMIQSNQEAHIKFINAYHQVVKKIEGKKAIYQPDGSEGFIRIEVMDKETQKKAWSQPFWLIKK